MIPTPPASSIRRPALLAACLVLAHLTPALRAEIQPAARALAASLSAKLATARTIRLEARHEIDPALGVGAKLERGPIEITFQRPNRFFALQKAGAETREIAFDGKSICVIHPGFKFHALEPLQAASVDDFADLMDARFGFRPPVAELLSPDVASQLFRHVTAARVTRGEWVGLARCDRLHFEQEGMTGDLWVATKDGLPRRYLLTFTSLRGSPTWDIRLKRWKLNATVDETLFSKRPAADSQKIRMLSSR